MSATFFITDKTLRDVKSDGTTKEIGIIRSGGMLQMEYSVIFETAADDVRLHLDMEKMLKNEDEFNQFIGMTKYSLVHFSANWSEMCEQLNNLLSELKDELKCFDFATVEAEEVPEVSVVNKIVAAPTVLFFKKGKEVDRLQGFDPGELRTKIIKHNFIEGNVISRLESLVLQSPLMLFMKGTPDKPQCGFSNQIVSLLRGVDADFSSFDVRQGLKEYSHWPTYPQLYLNGKLVGGLDILKEELNDPDFCNKLPKLKNKNGRLKALINKAPLMLFMKGSPEAPKCSKIQQKIIELLNDVNAAYSFFDILKDDEIRQGLKEYSNWPTYPQLYLNGELIGGLDLVTEELKNPSFIEKLPRES
ncbi:Glutaredoxin 3 [Dirofilaria immitis]|nr:Glutaredoxin 3 [Dirofilaria immitis]